MASSCNRCGKQLYAAWRTANGRHYHPHCFTCAICDSDILSVTNIEAADLKEIYCIGCFDQYFNKVSSVTQYDDEEDSQINESTCKPMALTRDKITENPYDSLESYVTPEESLNAIDQELSPHSYHARSQGSHHASTSKVSRERSDSIFKESIEEVIKDADLYSERQKRSSSTPSISMKCESNLSLHPSTFTSRIPRLKSLSKISSKTSIHNLQSESFLDSKKLQNIEKPNSILHINNMKLPSTKINNYLRSKGMKSHEISSNIAFPMKAKHSVSTFTQNVRSSSSRNYTVARSGSISRPASTTSMLRGVSTSNLPQYLNITNPPPLPISHLDFQSSTVSTTSIMKLPINESFINMPESGSSQNKRNNCNQKQRYIGSENSTRRRSLITLDDHQSLKNIPNVLPSCEQLLSIIMKPRNGYNNDSEHRDAVMLKLSPERCNREQHSNQNINDPLDCPICYEPLVMGSTSNRGNRLENSVTDCGHIFHRKCINNWLCDTGNSRCPICSKLCIKDSIIPVYLEANIKADKNLTTNENETSIATLRNDYQELAAKYHTLWNEHNKCSVKSLVTDSLRSAYEMECENRVELQWENKRLQRKIEELRAIIRSPQGDSFLTTP